MTSAAYLQRLVNLTEQFWEQHYPGGDSDEVGDGYEEVRESLGNMILLIVGK